MKALEAYMLLIGHIKLDFDSSEKLPAKPSKKNKNTRIILESESELKDFLSLLLEQLGRRAKHFKSPGNPKSIVQEITKLYTYF